MVVVDFTSPTLVVDEAPQAAFASSDTVDTTANSVNVATHPFETGDQVLYDATTLDATAVAIGGLTSGQNYFAIRVDGDNIKLASSLANANNGTAISLSGSPSGSQFFQGEQATVNCYFICRCHYWNHCYQRW